MPFFSNEIKNNFFRADGNYNKKFFLNKSSWLKSEYLETQIFGDLSLNDVSALYFQKNLPNQELVKILKDKNIKIYDYRNKQPILYEGAK